MARKTLPIFPTSRGISGDEPSLVISHLQSPTVTNCRVEQGSLKKRWGYSIDRAVGSKVYGVYLYQTLSGTRFTLYLTGTDLCCRQTGAGQTFSYITENYTTGTVDTYGGGTTVNFAGGADFVTASIAEGDQFIIDSDHSAHGGSNVEPNTHWATIASVTDLNTIVLSSAYTGDGTTGTYKIRKVNALPTNERPTVAMVGDKFCYSTGSIDVQYWAGTGNSAALNSTYATRARYIMEFANRLFLADTYISATRAPYSLVWSKEGDPTDYTDTTAGSLDILETDGYIKGIGRVGSNMIVYKEDSYTVWARTGVATSPIQRVSDKRGVGCIAPYSIVDFNGTNAFIGRDDFYVINGDQAESIGKNIRRKFFDNVAFTEQTRAWGGHNPNAHELMWTADTTSDGLVTFVYNYLVGEWYQYTWSDYMTAFGKGAI